MADSKEAPKSKEFLDNDSKEREMEDPSQDNDEDGQETNRIEDDPLGNDDAENGADTKSSTCPPPPPSTPHNVQETADEGAQAVSRRTEYEDSRQLPELSADDSTWAYLRDLLSRR